MPIRFTRPHGLCLSAGPIYLSILFLFPIDSRNSCVAYRLWLVRAMWACKARVCRLIGPRPRPVDARDRLLSDLCCSVGRAPACAPGSSDSYVLTAVVAPRGRLWFRAQPGGWGDTQSPLCFSLLLSPSSFSSKSLNDSNGQEH